MARRSAHNSREVEVASDRKSGSCYAGNFVALPRHGLFFLFEPWMPLPLLYLFYLIDCVGSALC
jgi:hypothetical protein